MVDIPHLCVRDLSSDDADADAGGGGGGGGGYYF